jgi:hypothetical protein
MDKKFEPQALREVDMATIAGSEEQRLGPRVIDEPIGKGERSPSNPNGPSERRVKAKAKHATGLAWKQDDIFVDDVCRDRGSSLRA